jgi:hypothetical protein
MALGNSWTFKDGTQQWSANIINVFTLQGATIYQADQIYPGLINGEVPFPHPYFCFSDTAFRITSQPELNDLNYFINVLKVPIVLGDSYVNTIGRWTVESLSETVTVAAGTFSSCARIKIVPLVNPNTDTHYFYLAPNVGLVKSYNPYEQHLIELVSYTVH